MSVNDTSYIPSLDGIRAIAALLVFVSHAGAGHIIPGGFGVTVFFFLSGYLITTLLRFEYEKYGRINLRSFYLRRVYRILPPLYIVLFIAFLVGKFIVGESDVSLTAFFAQVFQLTNYYVVARGEQHIIFGTAPMWSLAIEEHFYLLYPVLLLALLSARSRRQIAVTLFAICGIVLLWRLVLLLLLDVGTDYTYMATDARIDSLLYGCAMAIGFNPLVDHKERGKPEWFAVALGVSTLLLLSTFLIRDEVFRQTVRYSLQGVGLISFFYCAVRYSGWIVFRWLEWPVMRGLGNISYTFYLVHVLALAVVGHYLEGKVLVAVVALGCAIGFSRAMYLLVERKLGRLRRRLHQEPRLRATPTPSAQATN